MRLSCRSRCDSEDRARSALAPATTYDLRFGCFPITWASARPREHTCRCAPLGPEVLVKVFLAHSYPGFFRTGDPSRSLVFQTEDV